MRLQRQHVPQAPRRAHGQLSFVCSAPVCLFPSCRPQDSLLIRFVRSSPLPWVNIAWKAALLDEVGSGAVSDNNSTTSRRLPSSGQKIAS
jgi:hypothetical protein